MQQRDLLTESGARAGVTPRPISTSQDRQVELASSQE